MFYSGDMFVTTSTTMFNSDLRGRGHNLHRVKSGVVGILVGFNDVDVPSFGNGERWCVFIIDNVVGARFVKPESDLHLKLV